jgi:hypothetical protein
MKNFETYHASPMALHKQSHHCTTCVRVYLADEVDAHIEGLMKQIKELRAKASPLRDFVGNEIRSRGL